MSDHSKIGLQKNKSLTLINKCQGFVYGISRILWIINAPWCVVWADRRQSGVFHRPEPGAAHGRNMQLIVLLKVRKRKSHHFRCNWKSSFPRINHISLGDLIWKVFEYSFNRGCHLRSRSTSMFDLDRDQLIFSFNKEVYFNTCGGSPEIHSWNPSTMHESFIYLRDNSSFENNPCHGT